MVRLGQLNNSLNNDGRVSKIYIKFDDDKAGVKMMASDNYARQHRFVPIE